MRALPCTSFKLRNRSLESSAANSANMCGAPLSRCWRTSRAAFGEIAAACSTASFGSCVQVRHGATCGRPMVPARLVTIASFGGCWTYLADLPDVSNVYFGSRRVPATVHGVVFNILAGSAEAPPSAASGRLHHPIADDATARRLELSPYFPSGPSIFTNSPCTYSFPHTTCPVFTASSLPPMSEIVPPASRTMICPAAISQGCKLRSQ